jgi:hypothetical protein
MVVGTREVLDDGVQQRHHTLETGILVVKEVRYLGGLGLQSDQEGENALWTIVQKEG